MQRKRYSLIAGALLAVALLAAACQPEPAPGETPAAPTETAAPAESTDIPTGVPSETPTGTLENTATPAATTTPQISGPADFPAFINPLTGMTVSDTSLLERNPVMVKIANFPRGLRPQSGLSWADLVYEYYIGFGATRFSAIYYGQNPPEAGPVRSGRLIDAQLGNLYNTLLAFASADPTVYTRILNALGNRAVSEGPSTCPALCRTGSGDVNSVFAYPELMTDFASEQRGITPVRPVLNGTVFNPAVPEGGSAATKASIFYSSSTISEWRYDAASGRYLRYIEAVDANGAVSLVPLADRLTNVQLSAANVIVLFVETIEITPSLHDFNLANNFSGQRGLLFRDGQAYDIIWTSQGPQLPLQFFALTGELIALQPGNSWLHVVGLSSSTDEAAAGEWVITNFIP